MTGPIHPRVTLPSADERAISRRGTAPHQVTVADGVLSARPRNAPWALVWFPQLAACERDDVAVVSLRGELDSFGACVLQALFSDIRGQVRARCVADLADLAFIDRVCLGVLVRHCRQIRGRGASFALAGPQGAVRRVLSVTGLLSWFEVHDTVEEALAGAAARRSAGLEAAPARHWALR
jgi:anti-sigma B factor antagonist